MSSRKKSAGRAKPYRYAECGLENIYLANGFHQEETPYGETIRIEDPDGLHRAIGLWLARRKRVLLGREFRYLRHELSLSQRTLAHLLGVSEQAVARWEKGKTALPAGAAIILRKLYLEKIGKRGGLHKLIEALADLEERLDSLTLQETAEGWQEAA